MALGKAVRSEAASWDCGAVIGKGGSFGFTWFNPIGCMVDLQWFRTGMVRAEPRLGEHIASWSGLACFGGLP